MITASAQGVRKMSSKLRYVLQDFAYLKIDLVQGKNIFRVTNAGKTGMLEQITKTPETFAVFANITRLLKRLLAGVEPNEALFTDLVYDVLMLTQEQLPHTLNEYPFGRLRHLILFFSRFQPLKRQFHHRKSLFLILS